MPVEIKLLEKNAEKWSADRVDFHIVCSVFDSDSHAVVYFSQKCTWVGLR